MKFQITLDTYSGRPNPTWVLNDADSAQLVSRLEAAPKLMQSVDLQPSQMGLGYRGYIVEQLTPPEVSGGPAVPAAFRIGSGGSEAESFLLRTGSAFLPAAVLEATEAAPPAPVQPAPAGALLSCGSNYLTSDTDFSFWNTPAYQPLNNCYNFASNYRTNTFAQPGLRSGARGNNLTTGGLDLNVRADGYSNSCVAARNDTICAVLWPGVDFHFYHLAANRHWTHKPGRTAARNYDNSGRLISDPRTCNRGNYSVVAGFYYVDTHGNVR